MEMNWVELDCTRSSLKEHIGPVILSKLSQKKALLDAINICIDEILVMETVLKTDNPGKYPAALYLTELGRNFLMRRIYL